MHEELHAWLQEHYGCAAGMENYRKIQHWADWWRGEVDGFHEYMENAAYGSPVHRRMYGLHMAKKICEDWAALLLNDKTMLQVQPEVQKWLHRVLTENGFWRRSNYLVEKSFALGTGACLLRVNGISPALWKEAPSALQEDRDFSSLPALVHGYTVHGDPVRFWFDFVDASQIIPISVEGGEITEAAFLSDMVLRGKTYQYMEIHIREKDGYVIRNHYFRLDKGRLLEEHLPDMPPSEIRTGCPYPFFAILRPNIQNTAPDAGGLGQSVYADALDCLRGIDLAFNNFCRDLRLGGKKVFVNQSLLRRDESGNLYTPDDVAQQLFMLVGDSDLADQPLIEEHNPSLRTEENREAVQAQLDYLSFRCGLGTRHYMFTGVQGRAQLTATQYMGEKQDMRQSLAKHQQNVTAYLEAVTKPLLWVASHLLSLPVNCHEVKILYDDSYFMDAETERSRDLREVEAGLMPPEDFRRRWYDTV